MRDPAPASQPLPPRPPMPRPPPQPAPPPTARRPRLSPCQLRRLNARAAFGALVILGVAGCDRARHADDAICLSDAQAREVFLATGNPGPQTDLIVATRVSPARYEHGVIVLTGGCELRVVQPQAWRAATGTALAAAEAEREIDQAKAIESAIETVAQAAAELDQALARARDADAVQDKRRARADAAWRDDILASAQARIDSAHATDALRARQDSVICQERDRRLARQSREDSASCERSVREEAAAEDAIRSRWAAAQAAEDADVRARLDASSEQERQEAALAQARGGDHPEVAALASARRSAIDADGAGSTRAIQEACARELAQARDRAQGAVRAADAASAAAAASIRLEAERERDALGPSASASALVAPGMPSILSAPSSAPVPTIPSARAAGSAASGAAIGTNAGKRAPMDRPTAAVAAVGQPEVDHGP